ncbi:MAG: alpha/beta hydrolase [Lentisphaeria bacterium]|nr:alpha/beta hydrolase [Lentisphaeria bacterium]
MSLKRSLFAAALLAGLLLPAARAAENPQKYEQKNDLSYLAPGMKGGEYRQNRCTLDLYYPEGKKGFATVIWFHGGGLTGGKKSIPAALKNHGFAIAGVNYRLAPTSKTPEGAPNREVRVSDCIEDAAAAVGWVYHNIGKFGGDPKKIYITGHSAGGYLALMVGMAPKYLAPYGMSPSDLAGLMPLSGHTITHFTARSENGIGIKQPVVDELAPLYHVTTPDLPPILLITGDREKEMVGRYEENAYLMRMLKLNGHPVTLYEIQGYGHSMVYPAMPILLEHLKTQKVAE